MGTGQLRVAIVGTSMKRYSSTIGTHLLDLSIHLPNPLPPRMDIIGPSELVHLIPQISRQPDRRTRMPIIQRRHSIPLGDHRREVSGEFLEI